MHWLWMHISSAGRWFASVAFVLAAGRILFLCLAAAVITGGMRYSGQPYWRHTSTRWPSPFANYCHRFLTSHVILLMMCMEIAACLSLHFLPPYIGSTHSEFSQSYFFSASGRNFPNSTYDNTHRFFLWTNILLIALIYWNYVNRGMVSGLHARRRLSDVLSQEFQIVICKCRIILEFCRHAHGVHIWLINYICNCVVLRGIESWDTPSEIFRNLTGNLIPNQIVIFVSSEIDGHAGQVSELGQSIGKS